jgi:hypothetical protein
MKLVSIKTLYQTYSLMEGSKPETAWAVSVIDQTGMEVVQGIPQTVLEQATEFTKEWTGWGFDDGKALLLFKNKEDAVFAKLHFGEGAIGKN